MYESNDTNATRWFSIFIMGEKRIMGMVRSKEDVLPVDQLLLVAEIAEEYWSKSNSEEEKKELESTIAFTKIAFCVYL